MSRKFHAVHRVSGERWKPQRNRNEFLVMYDSGYLAVVYKDGYETSISPLDPKIWEIRHNHQLQLQTMSQPPQVALVSLAPSEGSIACFYKGVLIKSISCYTPEEKQGIHDLANSLAQASGGTVSHIEFKALAKYLDEDGWKEAAIALKASGKIDPNFTENVSAPPRSSSFGQRTELGSDIVNPATQPHSMSDEAKLSLLHSALQTQKNDDFSL